MQENNNRRKFFSKFGKGAVAAAIASVLPTTLLSKAPKNEVANNTKNITVSIHSSAVKRTN